jgi:hypothetical protein
MERTLEELLWSFGSPVEIILFDHVTCQWKCVSGGGGDIPWPARSPDFARDFFL